MTLKRRRPEEGSTDDNEQQPNVLSSTSTNEPAGVSALARGPMEAMIIDVEPLTMPLIPQVVKEQNELAKQEILAIMKENQANRAITSVPKKLKLQFRNKVSQPVYTGKPLIGEKETAIKIALVDAITGEIVKTGPESMAKLEIVGFRVGDTDNESNDDSWTFEDFHKRILSEKKGRRTLQGNTRLQLKEGACCFVDAISFTRSSENTRNGLYRLVAGVVDVALMNQVDIAMTEAFLMKDARALYSEKHNQPSLFDKVRHLRQIGGNRNKYLEGAGVITVKDLLTLLYTDLERLEEILKLKHTSKMWDDIVENAQASGGMFLYLDPCNERKTGVVLDVKLKLKALIVEPCHYIPVNHLSEKQKVDSQNLVKVASEHLKMLKACEDEASVKEHLLKSLIELNNSIPSLQITHSSPGPFEALKDLNNSNHSPTVTSESEWGKETVPFDDDMIYTTYYQEQTPFHPRIIDNTNGVPFDDDMIYTTTYYQEQIPFHLHNIDNTNGLNFGTATEPGVSSQTAGSLMDTCGFTNTYIFSQCLEPSELDHLLSCDYSMQSPNKERQCSPTNSDINAVMLASQTVPVCTTRAIWKRWSLLLRFSFICINWRKQRKGPNLS